MSHGISTLASFTWGKLMTNDSQPPFGFVGYHSGAPQDWRNLEIEHTVSSQDVRFQFNWQISWDLPIGKGRAVNLNGIGNTLLGGWTLNTITYLSDGVPIAAPSGTGSPYFNQRVNLTCDPRSVARRNAAQWFNYTCFSQPSDPSPQAPHPPTSPTSALTALTRRTSPSTRSFPSPNPVISAWRSPASTSPTPSNMAIPTSSGTSRPPSTPNT